MYRRALRSFCSGSRLWLFTLLCAGTSFPLGAEDVLQPEILSPGSPEEPDGKPIEARYLSIRPGIGVSNLSIKVRDGSGQSTQLRADRAVWPFLDLSTRDWKFNSWSGFNVWLHAERFEMKTQSIPLGSFQAESGSGGSDFEYPASKGIEGEYYSMHGTFYVEAPFFVMLGVGLGPAQTRFSGESEFFRLGLPFFYNNATRSEALELTRLWLINSGSLFRGQPIRDYFILQINQPGSLERLGQYYLLRGPIQFSPEDFVFYRYAGLDSQYNLLEFIALTQLNREKLKVRSPLLFSPMIYLEYHWLFLTFRLQWSGPRFSQGGYDYTIRSFNAALMLNWRW